MTNRTIQIVKHSPDWIGCFGIGLFLFGLYCFFLLEINLQEDSSSSKPIPKIFLFVAITSTIGGIITIIYRYLAG